MPLIPFLEPVSPRYIYINPATNRVHLLVPVVGGQEISTDNTCKSTAALRDFFDGGALKELNAYKEALAFDMELLLLDSPEREAKAARFSQIEDYISAVSAMRYSYGDAVTAFIGRPSNLYSIQLRPRTPDGASRVVNPVFSVNRTNDASRTPASVLYRAMDSMFRTTLVAAVDPRTRLTTAVLNVLSESASFSDIQKALKEQSLVLFGEAIDFTHRPDGTPVTQEVINSLMGFGMDATRDDYIDALLGACALDVWETLPTPPFYSIPLMSYENEKTERLSILTQFFLANLNVYCKARGLSTQNFGMILDESPELSNSLVHLVSESLTSGKDVEKAICNFCNDHVNEFGLSRVINENDLTTIRQKFERTYRMVTATNENPHMDDFMILDFDATGEMAKFVTHEGSICVNFAEIIDSFVASRNLDYFASIRADFASHPAVIPHRNAFVAGDIEVDIETLLARINDEQFKRLPTAVKEACRAHPAFQTRHFLQYVAQGLQKEAEDLLIGASGMTQAVLQTPGVFTDYSGRTFHCTAYEYAYWAKDTHMCRMLERYMNEETKADMLARIKVNDTVGLTYQQNGEEHHSAHFDLTALKTALQVYVDGYDAWDATGNWAAIKAAWMNVGKAQRDVPAHVAHEYCRPDRSFDPRPEFNEATLPRKLIFYDQTVGIGGEATSWFPLAVSHSGLGFDFALIRDVSRRRGAGVLNLGRVCGVESGRVKAAIADLKALSRLDEVRTADFALSQEHLNPSTFSQSMKV